MIVKQTDDTTKEQKCKVFEYKAKLSLSKKFKMYLL